MGKLAFIFSGQGAQKPGMGKSLSDANPAARGLFLRAMDALDMPVSTLCFDGPQEELNRTVNTQPCVFTVDMAAAYALFEQGVQPDGCAGFSLGELAALCCGEVFGLEDSFRIVTKRAAYMQQACDETAGGMAAVIGGETADIEALCAQIGDVWAVNYNCPGQTVVAGKSAALEAFLAAAKEKKLRAVPLPVSGAFHTELMRTASERLLADISAMGNRPPSIPVYGNTLARPYPTHPSKIRETLAGQLMKPVRWEETIRNMVSDGFTTFIECGPGGTLTGFFKRMKLEGIKAFSVENEEGLSVVLDYLNGQEENH